MTDLFEFSRVVYVCVSVCVYACMCTIRDIYLRDHRRAVSQCRIFLLKLLFYKSSTKVTILKTPQTVTYVFVIILISARSRFRDILLRMSTQSHILAHTHGQTLLTMLNLSLLFCRNALVRAPGPPDRSLLLRTT